MAFYTLPVGVATHSNASVKSVVSVSRKDMAVPSFHCSHDFLDLSDVDSFGQELSHQRTIFVASFIVDIVIERGLGSRQERNKLQVDVFIRAESCWP